MQTYQARPFIPVRPLWQREVHCGDVTLLHERYSGFVAEPHAHADLQITMPLAGRMHLVVAGQEHVVGPEAVIVLPAGIPHAVLHIDSEIDYLVATVTPAWLAGAQRALGLAPQVVDRPIIVGDAFLFALARHLAAEIGNPGPGSGGLLAAGIGHLGACLGRALDQPAPPAVNVPPVIMRAVERILRDYADDLTVEGLATEAAMSPRHFERLFKSAIGLSPRRYLIDVRIRAAKELLATTALPVIDVAVAVGYGHVSHFIATFRAATGLTPGRFRQVP